MATPKAAAIAISTVQSTERRACSPVRHRVISIKPAATASPTEVPVDAGGQAAEEAPASDGVRGEEDEPAS